MMDIVFSSTTQLAAAIRAGHVSATEVLKAHLAQIDKHNPALHAIITMDAEQAHERAREADNALARGQVWGPLHGVPFTLKDAHATAGMRTTTGFPPLADYVPQADSTVTARLKAAGGILIGKTNVPVLLADFQSNNPLFGRTNNPWNIERTPGGSRNWHRSGRFDTHPNAFLWPVWAEAKRKARLLSRTYPWSSYATKRPHHGLYWAHGTHR